MLEFAGKGGGDSCGISMGDGGGDSCGISMGDGGGDGDFGCDDVVAESGEGGAARTAPTFFAYFVAVVAFVFFAYFVAVVAPFFNVVAVVAPCFNVVAVVAAFFEVVTAAAAVFFNVVTTGAAAAAFSFSRKSFIFALTPGFNLTVISTEVNGDGSASDGESAILVSAAQSSARAQP